MQRGRNSASGTLATCVECGRVSGPFWVRWRAYRVDDPEEEGPPELGFYCPTCSWLEFGPPRRRPLVERRRAPRSS